MLSDHNDLVPNMLSFSVIKKTVLAWLDRNIPATLNVIFYDNRIHGNMI